MYLDWNYRFNLTDPAQQNVKILCWIHLLSKCVCWWFLKVCRKASLLIVEHTKPLTRNNQLARILSSLIFSTDHSNFYTVVIGVWLTVLFFSFNFSFAAETISSTVKQKTTIGIHIHVISLTWLCIFYTWENSLSQTD